MDRDSFEEGDVIRVVSKETNMELWEAIVVRNFNRWFGLRPKPKREGSVTINMCTDAFELFPLASKKYRYVRKNK